MRLCTLPRSAQFAPAAAHICTNLVVCFWFCVLLTPISDKQADHISIGGELVFGLAIDDIITLQSIHYRSDYFLPVQV